MFNWLFCNGVIGSELRRNKIPYVCFIGTLNKPKFYLNWREL
jgi:hypothetical protein